MADIPFAFGTVVNVSRGVFKGRNIIHETSVSFGEHKKSYYIEYSTDKGAWVDHDLCTLLEGPSEKSIRELLKALDEEYEE